VGCVSVTAQDSTGQWAVSVSLHRIALDSGLCHCHCTG